LSEAFAILLRYRGLLFWPYVSDNSYCTAYSQHLTLQADWIGILTGLEKLLIYNKKQVAYVLAVEIFFIT